MSYQTTLWGLASRRNRLQESLALVCLISMKNLHAKTPVQPITQQTNEQRAVLAENPLEFLYLDFWASWCPPCLEAFKWMDELHQSFNKPDLSGRQRLRIVAVNLDHDRGAAERFVDKFKPAFELVMKDGRAIASSFSIRAMPTSFLIDTRRHLIWSHQGFNLNDKRLLEAKINAALAQTV